VVCNFFNGAPGSESRAQAESLARTLAESVGPVLSLEVPAAEDSLVLLARRPVEGERASRPGVRDLRAAARAAFGWRWPGRRAARLVRGVRWVETGAEVEGGFAELAPPRSTSRREVEPGSLRRGSSAVSWLEGADPPQGLGGA